MDEIASIKSEIQLLTTRLAALELENASKQGTQSGGDPVAFGTDESSPIEIAKLRAFDVTCDGRENDPWLIYLPTGCISYAGFEPDEIDPAPDETTRLADLGTAIKDGGIYAHLYLEMEEDSASNSTSEPKVVGFQKLEIDTTPALTPTEDNIKIVNIKIATITDGAISQNVSSSLILGGVVGNKVFFPGRFDILIEKSSGSITASFSNCYYDVAGKTYEASSVSSVSINETCILALKVTATGSTPSADVVTYTSLGALQSAQGNLDYYTSPLYKIEVSEDEEGNKSASVVCDFRTGPVIAMGEF